MNRYSFGAEFWVNAETQEDAQTIVSNYVDGFPEQVTVHGAEPDCMLQDGSLVEEDVEVEDE